MKAILEDVSSVKKRLIVEIEAEEVDKKVNETYREVAKTARISGFRKGKVPRKILESYFGSKVLADVTEKLVKETLPKAIEQVKISPLAIPGVENEVLKEGRNYTYSALMEVRPEFELKDCLGIEVEKEICSVTDEDTNRQLEEIREANGNLVSVEEDRGIAENDYVIIDYKGFDDGRAIEGIKSDNFQLKVGKKEFYPGFEEDLIGLKKGATKEITIDFKEDYFHNRLAGKSVKFQTRVVDIKRMELPELNDDFANRLADDIHSLDDLKKKVKESLIKREEKRIDKDLKERLLKKISDSVDFELPDSLIDPEISYSIENIRQSLARSGSNFEKSGLDEVRLRKELRPAAENRVKDMLILGEIAEKNDLSINEADIQKGFEEMSKSTGQDPEVLRRYHEANNLMGSFRETLLQEKTLSFLVENAKVEEVKADKIRDE